jgi:UTP--glucose-1-phosphate uridylyltransferase
VIAVERVPREKVSSYGAIAGTPAPEFGKNVYKITDLVEKPPRDQAPSDLAIVGRYILTPDIFPALRETAKDKSGEIQLTNGMRALLKQRPLYAVIIDGVRHDTGSNLGFLKANAYFGLKRPEIAEAFRDYLKTLRP